MCVSVCLDDGERGNSRRSIYLCVEFAGTLALGKFER